MRLSSLLSWRKPVVVEKKEPEFVYPKGWNARLGGYYQTEEDRRREREEEEEYLRNGDPDGTYQFHTDWYRTQSYVIKDRFNAPYWDPYENDVLLVRPEPPPPKPPFKRYFVLAFLVWALMHWLYARHLRKKAAQQRELEIRRAHGIPDHDTRDWDIAYEASIRRSKYYENKWRVKNGLYPLANDKNGQPYLLKKWGRRFKPIPPPRPWEEIEAEKIRLWRLERRREWKKQQIASGKACMPPGGLDLSDEEAWDDEFDGVYLRQIEDPNDPRRFSPSFQARMLDPIDRHAPSPSPGNSQREPTPVMHGPSPAKQFPGEYPPTPMSPYMELMLNAPPVPDWDMSRPWQYCPPYVYQAPPRDKKLTGLQLVLAPMVPVGLPAPSPAPEKPQSTRSMSAASSTRSSKKRSAPEEPTDDEERAAKRQRTGTPSAAAPASPSKQTPPPAASADAPRGVKRSRSRESGEEDGPRKRSKSGDEAAPNPEANADPTAEQVPPVPEEEVKPDLTAEWRAMMEVFMEEGRRNAPYKEMQWGPDPPRPRRRRIPTLAQGNPSATAAASGGKKKTSPKDSSKKSSGPGPVRTSKRPSSDEPPKEKKPPKIVKRTTKLITTQRGTPVLSVEMMLTETGETLMEFSPPSQSQPAPKPRPVTPPPPPPPVERAPSPVPPPKPTPKPPRPQMTLPLQAPAPRKSLPPNPALSQTPLPASQLILKGAPKPASKKPRVPPHLVMYRASEHGNKPLKPSPLSSKPPITAGQSDDEGVSQATGTLTVVGQHLSTPADQATMTALPSSSFASTSSADPSTLPMTVAAIPSTPGSGLPLDGVPPAVGSSQSVQQPSTLVSAAGPASGSSAPSDSSPTEDVEMDQVPAKVEEEDGEAMISLDNLPPYVPSRAIQESSAEVDRRAAQRANLATDFFTHEMDPTPFLDTLMELADSTSDSSSPNADLVTSISKSFDLWTSYPFSDQRR